MKLDIWKQSRRRCRKVISKHTIQGYDLYQFKIYTFQDNMYLPGFPWISICNQIHKQPARHHTIPYAPDICRRFGSNHVTSLRMNVTQNSGSLFCNFRWKENFVDSITSLDCLVTGHPCCSIPRTKNTKHMGLHDAHYHIRCICNCLLSNKTD